MTGLVASGMLLLMVLGGVGAVYAAAENLRVARHPLRRNAFNSGLGPAEHAVSRFHPRWYTASIVFLAFDMEMVFMYPWSLVVAEVGMKAVVEMFGFLLVLLVGVGYAWREGALRWT